MRKPKLIGWKDASQKHPTSNGETAPLSARLTPLPLKALTGPGHHRQRQTTAPNFYSGAAWLLLIGKGTMCVVVGEGSCIHQFHMEKSRTESKPWTSSFQTSWKDPQMALWWDVSDGQEEEHKGSQRPRLRMGSGDSVCHGLVMATEWQRRHIHNPTYMGHVNQADV